MGKAKDRRLAAVAATQTPAVTTPPEQVVAENGAKALENYRTIYKDNPNKALRMVGTLAYCRDLTSQPDMTWEQFCDLKIKTFTDFWTIKKTKPSGTRAIKVLAPEDVAKAKKQVEYLKKRQARLDAAIKAAEAKAAPAK